MALRDRVSTFTPWWWLQLPVVLVVLGASYRLLALPLGWLGGYWLPRRFGLLDQPFHRWLWDATKGTVVGALITLLAAGLLASAERISLPGALMAGFTGVIVGDGDRKSVV